jgi:CCR4-NOT transcription complex subunit 1
MANQLRYPNNHTHYFSWILLYLFLESPQEVVKEQITRVLLERLIVHRPHPWGLLITFIELIKNPRYDFWNHSFTHCAPEIKKLFESVAATCGSSSSSQSPTNE